MSQVTCQQLHCESYSIKLVTCTLHQMSLISLKELVREKRFFGFSSDLTHSSAHLKFCALISPLRPIHLIKTLFLSNQKIHHLIGTKFFNTHRNLNKFLTDLMSGGFVCKRVCGLLIIRCCEYAPLQLPTPAPPPPITVYITVDPTDPTTTTTTTTTTAPTTYSPQNITTSPSIESGSSWPVWLIILLVVLGLLVVAGVVALFTYFGGGGGETRPKAGRGARPNSTNVSGFKHPSVSRSMPRSISRSRQPSIRSGISRQITTRR